MAEICVAMSQSRLLRFLLLLGILILGVSGQVTVTIEATPNMTTYEVGNNLTLMCTLDPAPTDTSITVTYLWECSDCFADGLTMPTISQVLTDMDTAMIDCSVNVSGNVIMTDMPFDLQVTRVPAPTVTFQPSSPIPDMVGDLLSIECRVDTVPGVSSSSVMISWTAPGGVGSIMNNSRVTISPTTSSGNVFTSSLQFAYLMEGDEGTYTCNWTILQSSGSETVELQLTIPNPIVSVIAPDTQTVGQSLTLQCEVTAVRGISSRVDIVWSSGGTELERMNNVSSTMMGNSLVYTDSYTISLLSTDDEGRVIQCEVVINASPPVMASNTITLDVTVPTPAVNVTAPSNQIVGQSLTLQCNVTTVRGITSRVDISWNDDDTTEFQRTNNVSPTTMGDSLVYTDSYTISQLNTTDEDRFIQCEVVINANPLVAASDNTTLDVTVPTPTVTISPAGPIQGAMVGSRQVINCTVSTVSGVVSSSVMISWMGPGGVITNDSRVTISPTTSSGNTYTSSLQFTYLMEGDNGTYTCNVMILDTSGSQSVELQSLTIPTPNVSVTAPDTQTVGRSLTLQCEVTAVRGITSRVDIVWNSGGTELERMNDVSSTTMGNSLVYTDSYTISQLSTTDEGRVIQCEVVINVSPSVMASDIITLDVTVPIPTVNVTALTAQTVGQSLTLQCEVTAVRGITSRVDIVWSSGSTELQRVEDVSSTTMGNSLVYTNSYIIVPLGTANESDVIQCEVVINASPPVMASDSITLDVTVPTPTVTISPSGPIQGAMVGSSQDIDCTASTVIGVESSSVMISWMGPDGSITATNGRVSIGSVTDDGNNMYTRSLQFTYLMEGDNGTYTCNVMILDTSGSQSYDLRPLMLAAPSNFRNTSVTSDSTTFQWSLLIEDVLVSWYVITCFEGSIILTTNVTGTSTMGTIDGLIPFTNYNCTIHTVIMTADGPMSDPIVVRTAEAAPSPPVINAVTAIDSTSVRVEWSAPTNPNGMLTIYTIVYNIEGGSNRTANVPYNGQSTQSYDITGLSPYQLVTVTITATNGGGTSDPSVARDGRSGEAAAGVVEIASVVGTSDSTAIVFWTPPSQPNGDITGYQIIYSLYRDTTDSMNQAVTSNENSFVITNLNPGMPYQVVVVAFNSRGNGAENQPQTFFSQELIPTDPPQNVMVDRISGEYINISWNPLTLNEARGFPVYTVTLTPSTGNDGQQITDGVIVVDTTESSIVVGGLDVNIEYMLTVAVGTTAGQMMSDGGFVIMKSTSQTSDRNDDNNTTSVIFIVLFIIAVVIIILLIIVIVYFVIKARKNNYSPNNAAHIYDAVELQQNIKSSTICDYEAPSVGSSGKILSTTRSKQDIKADTVALQENPSYVATDEFS